MSAGVSNLGFGWDPQRNTSATVAAPDFAAQQAALAAQQQQQLAGLNRPQDPSSFLDSLVAQQAKTNFAKFNDPANGYVQDGSLTYDNIYKSLRENAGAMAQAGTLQSQSFFDPQLAQQYVNYAGNQSAGMGPGYGTPGAYAGQMAQYGQQANAIQNSTAEQAAKLKAEQDAFQNNQAVQQQAYGQQTGGGFNGGILNSSYSQPFGNTITGTQNPAGGFSGGLMSGAGQTAAPSTGLTPFGAGGASTGQQPAPAAGWGGPFSAKNPWSLG